MQNLQLMSRGLIKGWALGNLIHRGADFAHPVWPSGGKFFFQRSSVQNVLPISENQFTLVVKMLTKSLHVYMCFDDNYLFVQYTRTFLTTFMYQKGCKGTGKTLQGDK